MSSEDWAGFKEAKKEHKQVNYDKNYRILVNSRLSFIARNNDTEFFIRQTGKPDVVFWPTTNKWRRVGATGPSATMHGDANAFLKWYAKATPARFTSELAISAKADWLDKLFALDLEWNYRNGR